MAENRKKINAVRIIKIIGIIIGITCHYDAEGKVTCLCRGIKAVGIFGNMGANL